MMKRMEFLLKNEETLKATLPVTAFDLTNGVDKEKLMKNISDCRSQLVSMCAQG